MFPFEQSCHSSLIGTGVSSRNSSRASTSITSTTRESTPEYRCKIYVNFHNELWQPNQLVAAVMKIFNFFHSDLRAYPFLPLQLLLFQYGLINKLNLQMARFLFLQILHFLLRWSFSFPFSVLCIIAISQPAVDETTKKLKCFNKSLRRARSFRSAREKINNKVRIDYYKAQY